MRHEILAFDKSTEQLAFRIEIQANRFGELAELMAWTDPNDAIYEYELTFEVELAAGCDVELKQITRWLTPQRGDEGYDLDAGQAAPSLRM